MKRIGILTSGGDTPGMNAAIRAVFKMGDASGLDIMGIYHGYHGLMEGRIQQLTHDDVENIVHKGGTVLRTARSEVFRTDKGCEHALRVIDAFRLEGIIVIGGDGSMAGATRLAEKGVPVICLPGTIDNDLGYTDYCIGFDTAANSVMSEIYKIRDTMRSHDRVGAIEVMGRACGDIALHAGIAGGVDFILVPEENGDDYSTACAVLVSQKLRGKLTSIVLIAEGAGGAADFCEYVTSNSDIDIRPIVLGYIQRGGNPSMLDRLMAAEMGAKAISLLQEGAKNRAIGKKNNVIFDMDLVEALQVPKVFESELYEINKVMARF